MKTLINPKILKYTHFQTNPSNKERMTYWYLASNACYYMMVCFKKNKDFYSYLRTFTQFLPHHSTSTKPSTPLGQEPSAQLHDNQRKNRPRHLCGHQILNGERDRSITNPTYGFHKWGYPNSWMIYKGKSHLEMDNLEVPLF